MSTNADDDKSQFDGEWIAPMLPRARAVVERAGFRFSHSIEIRSHRDISSFVKATGRTHAELRAWTTWKTIHLLSRGYWREQDDQSALARLVHELVHSAMFGSFGSEARALAANVPFFWLEGAASVIAQQESKRMPLDVIRARLLPGENPLRDATLASSLRYGAAHHAGALLRQRFGLDIFSKVSSEAALDATSNTIERALSSQTGFDVNSLWSATQAQHEEL